MLLVYLSLHHSLKSLTDLHSFVPESWQEPHVIGAGSCSVLLHLVFRETLQEYVQVDK